MHERSARRKNVSIGGKVLKLVFVTGLHFCSLINWFLMLLYFSNKFIEQKYYLQQNIAKSNNLLHLCTKTPPQEIEFDTRFIVLTLYIQDSTSLYLKRSVTADLHKMLGKYWTARFAIKFIQHPLCHLIFVRYSSTDLGMTRHIWVL